MRLVLQRVFNAKVTANGEVAGEIGPGLIIFLGIQRSDTEQLIEWAVRKILNTRLWEDDQQKPWSTNVMQREFSVLVVSQFTLYGYLKGNRPDFHNAMETSAAQQLYEAVLHNLRQNYTPERIQNGAFGQRMQIEMTHDGPVTLILESN